MLAERKRFENLQRGIFEMIHNQKEYNEFMSNLKVIMDKKKKARRKIRHHSYD